MMARRKTSRGALWLVFAGVGILGVLALAGAILLDPHRTKARLDLDAYIESPTAFSGNTYFLEGTIRERLARSSAGTVYSVEPTGQPLMPIVVPQRHAPAFNVEKGQKLSFDLRVADDGSLVATQVSKK